MSPWFPARWPAEDPDLIQLYTMNTPNGQKVSLCLEEMGLAYEPHTINLLENEQFDTDYLQLSPHGEIPALLDPHGPEDVSVTLMESSSILQYLADKTGAFFPRTYRGRLEGQQWLALQTAHIGPLFGQFGHFLLFARDKTHDSYALDRYTREARRLLKVLETRLSGRDFILEHYSIVDMAILPWVEAMVNFYKAAEVLEFDSLKQLQRWRARLTERPAWQRGKEVGRLS